MIVYQYSYKTQTARKAKKRDPALNFNDNDCPDAKNNTDPRCTDVATGASPIGWGDTSTLSASPSTTKTILALSTCLKVNSLVPAGTCD